MTDRAIDRIAAALTIVFLAALLWFGATYHWVEQVNSAEEDAYVTKAEALLTGQVPRDVYRPLGYPLLAAAAGWVTGDPFEGARAVSSVAAAALVLLTYLLGRRLASPRVGLLAMVGLIANYWTITEGVHVTTDMTFAALSMLALLVAVLLVERRSVARVATLGVACGLACWVRYTGVALLPMAALAVVVPLRGQRRRLTGGLAVLLAAMGVILLPHFYLTWRTYGSPLYQENWRNLAFKLYGQGNWSYLGQAPFHSTWSVISTAPLYYVRAIGRELASLAHPYLGILLAPDIVWARALAAIGFAAGVGVLVAKRAARSWLLAAYIGAYLLLICATFFPWPRLILPLLGVGFILLANLVGLAHRRLRSGRLAWALWIVPVALLALQVCGLSRDLSAFAAQHPTAEVAAARELESRYGTDIVVLGTFHFASRYVGYRYLQVPPSSGDDEAYFTLLRAYAAQVGARYLVAGRLTLGSRPAGLMSGAGLPDYLLPLWRDADVAVYEIRLEGS